MTSDRKALVVGINKYKYYPENNLNGCVNDTKSMVAFLKKYKNFKDDDITVLADEKATKANITKNLRNMVKGANEGKYKYLVFTMSSHGTQVADTEHDEPDGLDEAFCPHDLKEKGDNWDPAHVIVDDELNKLFKQAPVKTVVEVWLDTCHSGTGMKLVRPGAKMRSKYIPPPSKHAIEQAIKFEKKMALAKKSAGAQAAGFKHILWAACKADETSSDAQINGTYNGAFTYYFCSEADACGFKLKPTALLAKIQADTRPYGQTPQYDDKATTR